MAFFETGNIIKNVVYNIAGSDFKDLVTLVFGWKKIVGKLLSERAKIIKFENKILFIAVTNNVWMQELVLRKYKIMQDIQNKLYIKLDDIIFFIGTRRKY
ncbi:MAG: DUF721 domain-containing protein [Candidatus Cloacimonetes bacterium]|nr:DUF721 domain-containing protein [Candidatus Cloacimonadota bacterium]